MAEPLDGGELVDPHGGRGDLGARRLRMVSPRSLADDPLRTLRAVRFAVELGFAIEPATRAAVREHAAAIAGVSPGARVRRAQARRRRRRACATGIELMDATGLLAAVLPELTALRGVEQSVYHHADVLGHTLEVLDAGRRDGGRSGRAPGSAASSRRRSRRCSPSRWPTRSRAAPGCASRRCCTTPPSRRPATCSRPAASRSSATTARAPSLARAVLRRLRASERLAGYVAGLTRHHLDLGFLVHERPLSRRTIWRYLTTTAPNSADVTLLTVADRLATRGRKAEPAIAAHLELAREMLGHAFALREAGPQPPLVPGDELAAELGIRPGPELGELLRALEEDRFAGEISTREQAVARARELLEAG